MQAASFCEVLIENLNKSSVEDIESLVTEALQYIFEEDYVFKMNPTTKRGSVTYVFTLQKSGEEIDDIYESQGGGLIQVISILMRIVTILINKKHMAKTLILDESLGMLSEEYIDNASKFFKDLGNKLGFRIILVTHQQKFIDYADVAYQVDHGKVTKL